MGVSRFLTGIRLIGLLNTLRSLHYTLLRQWIHTRFPPIAGSPGTLEPPGRLLETHRQPAGARLRFERADLDIQFLLPDLVRITWGPAILPMPYALARTEWPQVPVIVRFEPGRCEVASEALRVEVGGDGSLRFRDATGVILRDEFPPTRRGDELVHRAKLRPDEVLYGLGNRALPLNLRGRTYHIWNRDPGGGHRPGEDPLYLCIPVYLARHGDGGYLVFYENTFPATVTFGEHAEARFQGGALRYYLIPGPPSQALERYTELTGRPPLPPRWALGYHQSRWSYGSEAEVREVAEGFQTNGLPLSAIHLDIHYMDGYRVFTVDRKRFPDLAGLAQELGEKGIRLVTILDPGVKNDPEYAVFREGSAEGVFCALPDSTPARAPVWPGWCAFPDFTDPQVRGWWGRQYPRLLEKGISGFWHDMNEPATFAAWGDPTLPLPTRHSLDGRGGDHREAHNLYGFLMARAGYEALREHQPERRPFIFSRSGWAGLQRYAWNWTGDTESTWTALRQTVPTVVSLGLSGIPYTGPDIGGYSGAPSAELYLRWFQLATFLPLFRTHSALLTPRREPWTFGEPYLSIAREFLRLRYRLLPYLYTLAWEATQKGHPLVRPLFWPDGRDRGLWEVQDAFLLGDALLVAPVLEQGVEAREVTLPEGTWYGLFDDRVYQGPDRIVIEAPLEQIPVLVRAGSVLPMEEPRKILLHLYPPTDVGGGLLYADAGDGYGPGRLDRFRLRREEGSLMLTWESEGDYPFPYPDVEVRVHAMKVRRAVVDGNQVPCDADRIHVRPFVQARFEP